MGSSVCRCQSRLQSATASGILLTLNYNKVLNAVHTPEKEAYTVIVNGVRTTPKLVIVWWKSVNLVLGTATKPGDDVIVSYQPGKYQLRDFDNNLAAAFSNYQLTVKPADKTSPVLQSATVNELHLRLKYNELLDPGSVPSNKSFIVKFNDKNAYPSGVAIKGDTVDLTLASAVSPGDAVSVNYLVLIKNIKDISGNWAAPFLNQQVSNLTPQAGAPRLQTATVNGAQIILTYNKYLDSHSVPDITDYSVLTNEAQANLINILIDECTVQLQLSVPVITTDKVILKYVPGQHPVQDSNGAQAAGFENLKLNNITPMGSLSAPQVASNKPTTLAESTAFLYAGSDPVQMGVSANTIDSKRAAVIRGRILDQTGNPIANVRVSISGQPKYGTTTSRTDGWFDMAVNGGGSVVVDYKKYGYIAAQRQIAIPWQDYVVIPNTVMIPYDSKVTKITLGSGTTDQVAQGSVIADERGTRQATILFAAGTTAQAILPNGTSQTLTDLDVRATEYTVGETGMESMPSQLPANVGYTYCAEFSVDQAVEAEATSVKFSQPVVSYVDNFLNFPVGGVVPVGYYDREKNAWIPSENGRIIKILGIENGLAQIDIDGNNQPASQDIMNALGITGIERQRLGTLYQVGKTLWRSRINHFSPFDYNWPVGPSPKPPKLKKPTSNNTDKPCTGKGSIIEYQNQALGENYDIQGTPFTLDYRSSRMVKQPILNIQISDDSDYPELISILLKITIAGRTFTEEFPPQPNQDYQFIWDGRDAYGRLTFGEQTVNVAIIYTYPAYYQVPVGNRAFGNSSGLPTPVRGPDYKSTFTWSGTMRATDFLIHTQSLGGWTLNACHGYDTQKKVLYLGDGTYRDAKAINLSQLKVIAGNGELGITGDGGKALDAKLAMPMGLTVGADGSLYIAEVLSSRIRKIDSQGNISTFAGIGLPGFSGDGLTAKLATLKAPISVAEGADGSLYIADMLNNRIRKVSPNGIISTVAGQGPGVEITLPTDPSQIEGDFIDYILQQLSPPDPNADIGDGKPATEASLYGPCGVAVGTDGSIYIADTFSNRIRRVGPDGIIQTIAGTGVAGNAGNNGPAFQAQLDHPGGVGISQDGNIYILDINNAGIRCIGNDGIISNVSSEYSKDPRIGEISQASAIAKCTNVIAVGQDMQIYMARPDEHRIYILETPTPWLNNGEVFIPSEDGNQLYIFNEQGRHLRTINALTGILLYEFSYDNDGRVVSIKDVDGNLTIIKRDESGHPLSITAPGGQETNLSLDVNGYLNQIADPSGGKLLLSCDTDGYLTQYADARGNQHKFAYDESGRLMKDEDPAGGFTSLNSNFVDNGWTVTSATAMGRTRNYTIENMSGGETRYTKVIETGAQKTAVQKSDRTLVQNYPDGTEVSTLDDPDKRWGMLAPIQSQQSIKTPAGLTKSIQQTRTVTLTDKDNPLSLEMLVDTLNINGNEHTSSYNAEQKTITSKTAVGRQTVSNLDDKGRIVQSSVDGIDPVSYTYNTVGLLTEAKQGTVTSTFTYDEKRRLTTISDSSGNVVSYTYNDSDRIASMTLPGGQTYSFQYDANGNRTQVIMPSGAVHQMEYTVTDLGAGYSPPGQTGYTNSYDLDGKLSRITLPGGRTIDTAQDSAGRITSTDYDIASINYGYSDNTTRISEISRNPKDGGIPNSISYTYDGELVTGMTISGDASAQYAYQYDNNFNLIGITMNGTLQTNIQYDADGLLAGVDSFTFDRSGPVGAPVGITDGKLMETLQYDSLGRLKSRVKTVNNQAIYKMELEYNDIGKITRKTETTGTAEGNVYEYTYDPNGQLTSVTLNGSPVETYTYDANGNRLSRQLNGDAPENLTYDQQDRLQQQGSVTYQYDADGFMTQRGSDTFQYSATGELLNTNLADGQQAAYGYDGLGRRISRTDETGTYQYLYGDPVNPFRITASKDPAGNLTTYYYDPAGLLLALERDGNRYYVAADQVGTPKAVSDQNGEIIKVLEYDSFGKIISDSNPDFYLPISFAGGLGDQSTGLIRFGLRDYSPETGRWAARDPILFQGGQGNLYLYCGNSPIELRDPSGLKASSPCQSDSWWNDPAVWKKIGKGASIVGGVAAVGAMTIAIAPVAIPGAAVIATGTLIVGVGSSGVGIIATERLHTLGAISDEDATLSYIMNGVGVVGGVAGARVTNLAIAARDGKVAESIGFLLSRQTGIAGGLQSATSN